MKKPTYYYRHDYRSADGAPVTDIWGADVGIGPIARWDKHLSASFMSKWYDNMVTFRPLAKETSWVVPSFSEAQDIEQAYSAYITAGRKAVFQGVRALIGSGHSVANVLRIVGDAMHDFR